MKKKFAIVEKYMNDKVCYVNIFDHLQNNSYISAIYYKNLQSIFILDLVRIPHIDPNFRDAVLYLDFDFIIMNVYGKYYFSDDLFFKKTSTIIKIYRKMYAKYLNYIQKSNIFMDSHYFSVSDSDLFLKYIFSKKVSNVRSLNDLLHVNYNFNIVKNKFTADQIDFFYNLASVDMKNRKIYLGMCNNLDRDAYKIFSYQKFFSKLLLYVHTYWYSYVTNFEKDHCNAVCVDNDDVFNRNIRNFLKEKLLFDDYVSVNTRNHTKEHTKQYTADEIKLCSVLDKIIESGVKLTYYNEFSWGFCRDKKPLRFDLLCILFENNNLNMFVIESDGTNHYCCKTGSDIDNHQRDIMKQYYLSQMNIHLLRVLTSTNRMNEIYDPDSRLGDFDPDVDCDVFDDSEYYNNVEIIIRTFIDTVLNSDTYVRTNPISPRDIFFQSTEDNRGLVIFGQCMTKFYNFCKNPNVDICHKYNSIYATRPKIKNRSTIINKSTKKTCVIKL